MGCGVSQSVLRGNDDFSKSDAFIQLCTGEKNPIAMQLNGYFNSLVSECLYKSQGDMSGYERLLAKRPTEITVNRSKLAAQRHGIGHKPLTVDGINDIMNLFLGHVIKSLEKRKWSGTFNYALMQPLPEADAPKDNHVSDGHPSLKSPTHFPQASLSKKGFAAGREKVTVAPDSVASGNRSNAAITDDTVTDGTVTAMPSSRKSKASAFSMPSTVVGRSSTLVFIDQGNGTRSDDDPNRQWRMELTGNITYPSIDGALTLICDCKVTFLFFTCDANLPAVPSNAKLSDDGAQITQEAVSNPIAQPVNSATQAAAEPKPQPTSPKGSTEANTNSHTRIMSEPHQAKSVEAAPIAAVAR